jgi:ADP-heptose:LPS heptosyltransferase
MDITKKQRVDIVLGTLFLIILRLPVLVLGELLKRDHNPIPKGDILVIKMQGGGSLVLAFPALLGIRNRYRNCRVVLLTTPSVLPFAESLDLFDKIICVKDRGLLSLMLSGIYAWWNSLRVDTIIDLEVYSRLTTVFSVLTLARNRIGFYLESTFWRRGLHTHLIFFNRYAGVYHFYNEIARLLSAPIETRPFSAEHLRRNLPQHAKSACVRISIGHACSDFGAERMLSASQWVEVFHAKKVTSEEIVFLGAPTDHRIAEEIIYAARHHFPQAAFINKCGALSLKEAVACIGSSDEFWGIDSGLLHYARLLGKKNISFWGPTDPLTRLQDFNDVITEVYYQKIPCSPCLHVAETPPCKGENFCLRTIFQLEKSNLVTNENTKINKTISE